MEPWEDTDLKFADELKIRGKSNCPTCNRKIDRGDVAWHEGSTDAGTPFTWSTIQCQGCQTEIGHWSSWYPGADDWETWVDEVLPDWED